MFGVRFGKLVGETIISFGLTSACAAAGASFGTIICPFLGTVGGAIIGGIIGGIISALVCQGIEHYSGID